MKINRELQCFILCLLKKSYPVSRTDIAVFKEFEAFSENIDRVDVIGNLIYLEEHELIISGLIPNGSGGYQFSRDGMRITCKGIDFLEEDGGLSAILNCVTVRIHDETLARVEKFLAQSHLPEPQKKHYIARLRELPYDATKHLVCKLLDLALGRTPDALQLIQKLLA